MKFILILIVLVFLFILWCCLKMASIADEIMENGSYKNM